MPDRVLHRGSPPHECPSGDRPAPVHGGPGRGPESPSHRRARSAASDRGRAGRRRPGGTVGQPVELRHQVRVVGRASVDRRSASPLPRSRTRAGSPRRPSSASRPSAVTPPTSAPRSAYGPAWSTRTRTARPTRRVAGQVDELVPARAARQPDAAIVRRRRLVARSWSCDRGGVDGVDEDLDLRPTHAWLRSSPIPSWSASSSFRRRRLTSGGTSSARCVAGVPGRGEYAAAKTWS